MSACCQVPLRGRRSIGTVLPQRSTLCTVRVKYLDDRDIAVLLRTRFPRVVLMIELPPFEALALSLHHSPGVHALVVGSDVSRAAGIPTGWEITLDLVRRLASLDGITDHDDWAQWYRGKYGKAPSYSEILDALASTSAERRAILHSYIDPPEGVDLRKPTKAHCAIAQLVA